MQDDHAFYGVTGRLAAAEHRMFDTLKHLMGSWCEAKAIMEIDAAIQELQDARILLQASAVDQAAEVEGL